jgi:hypothetical protein
MIALLAPTLPPIGGGAHCDASVLPELKFSLRLHAGNTTQSQSGETIAGGRATGEHHNYYQRISKEQFF